METIKQLDELEEAARDVLITARVSRDYDALNPISRRGFELAVKARSAERRLRRVLKDRGVIVNA